MTKTLDWSKIATVNFDDRRRKARGQLTSKELFQKCYDNLQKAQDVAEARAQAEPILRNALIEHMVSKQPIKVLQPINNPTETVGGLAKSEEDDGFYFSGGSSSNANSEAALSAKFIEVMETIPVGTDLVYKGWDRQLGQWLFKGSNGQEYAIYDKPVIMFQGQGIENPGLFGLLYNTSLTNALNNDAE